MNLSRFSNTARRKTGLQTSYAKGDHAFAYCIPVCILVSGSIGNILRRYPRLAGEAVQLWQDGTISGGKS